MSKQKFKGKTLYTKTCVDNIIRVYQHADEDTKQQDWYDEARSFACDLAAHYNTTTMQVAGVIAALSPQKSWEENMKLAEALLRTDRAGHTRTMVNKAKAILALEDPEPSQICDILNGNKITSFFLNIYDINNKAVTIDRHAMDVAIGKVHDGNRQMTVGQYQFFENCYRAAAVTLDVPPYHVQAVTWVHWRELKQVGAEESLSENAEL